MTSGARGPHRRRDPLGDRWVLVSPQRLARPWQGEEEAPEPRGPAYEPECFLCPGNTRTSGAVNPGYDGPFVFPNDFPALGPGGGGAASDDPLLRAEPVTGTARVLCFSPDHSATLPELPLAGVRAVVDAWCKQSAELGREHRWVQLFENKGAAMGCSNPHPHGQIWASDHLPDLPATEDRTQREWLARRGRPMLAELAEREAGGERVVVQTADWLAIVPWWASWPFETLLLPRFDVQRLPELTDGQRDGLADAVRRLTIAYDNLFATSFPYSMGWHGAPFATGDWSHWRLHAHFFPPLLRSASVRKFMVGYELLAEAQRDLTPEAAAERLRAQPACHYRTAR